MDVCPTLQTSTQADDDDDDDEEEEVECFLDDDGHPRKLPGASNILARPRLKALRKICLSLGVN